MNVLREEHFVHREKGMFQGSSGSAGRCAKVHSGVSRRREDKP